MLSETNQMYVAESSASASRAWEWAGQRALDVQNELLRPFYLLKPRMFPDGNQWCALYGTNLQEGVAGFGDTPEAAAIDFDIHWLNERRRSEKGLQ